jgi:hypothetical protein
VQRIPATPKNGLQILKIAAFCPGGIGILAPIFSGQASSSEAKAFRSVQKGVPLRSKSFADWANALRDSHLSGLFCLLFFSHTR